MDEVRFAGDRLRRVVDVLPFRCFCLPRLDFLTTRPRLTLRVERDDRRLVDDPDRSELPLAKTTETQSWSLHSGRLLDTLVRTESLYFFNVGNE